METLLLLPAVLEARAALIDATTAVERAASGTGGHKEAAPGQGGERGGAKGAAVRYAAAKAALFEAVDAYLGAASPAEGEGAVRRLGLDDTELVLSDTARRWLDAAATARARASSEGSVLVEGADAASIA